MIRLARILRFAALMSGLALSLADCAGPDPVLYTLAAQPGPAVTTAGHPPIRSIELRRVDLASYLDRTGIVRAATAYRLQVSQDARWAAPIGSMLEGVIAEDLILRLPGVSVFTESGGLSAQPDRVVKIDIRRLDADPTGDVVLQAQVAVFGRDASHPTDVRSFRIAQRPASSATEDQVAAMSTVVAGLADGVAQMLH